MASKRISAVVEETGTVSNHDNTGYLKVQGFRFASTGSYGLGGHSQSTVSRSFYGTVNKG